MYGTKRDTCSDYFLRWSLSTTISRSLTIGKATCRSIHPSKWNWVPPNTGETIMFNIPFMLSLMYFTCWLFHACSAPGGNLGVSVFTSPSYTLTCTLRPKKGHKNLLASRDFIGHGPHVWRTIECIPLLKSIKLHVGHITQLLRFLCLSYFIFQTIRTVNILWFNWFQRFISLFTISRAQHHCPYKSQILKL